MMVIVGDYLGEIQSHRSFNPVVEFLLGVLSIGKSFDLEDDDMG